MQKPLFSFALITRNEEVTLPRLLKSLDGFKEAGGTVVICDTGSTDKTVEIAREWGAIVEEVGEKYLYPIDKELSDNINKQFIEEGEDPCVQEGDKYFWFAQARNHVASMSPTDMVSFVDADEVMVNLDIDKINSYIEEGYTQFEYLFCFSHKPDGSPEMEFNQSKFHSKAGQQWLGRVHEYLSGGSKKKYLTTDEFRLEHWQIPGDRHSYLKGLAVDCYYNLDTDRNSHYFARELLYNNRQKSAIKEFKRHISMGGWLSERAESMVFIGDAYGMINEPDLQAEWYSKAFHLDPSRRVALIKLAQFYEHNKNYRAAIAYASAALTVPLSPHYANNMSHYEDVPHAILFNAHGWTGNIKGAQDHLLKCLEYQPYNEYYLNATKYYFEYGDPLITGWMRFPELQFLYETSKKHKTIAEVGSFKGKSTHALLSGGANVTAIDHFEGSQEELDGTHGQQGIYEAFLENTKVFKNLTVKKMSGEEAAKDGEMYDCVFLDAGHSYEEVKEDIKNWLPHAKKMLCGHDYSPAWSGVMKAVDEAFGKPDGVCDSIWFVDLNK